MTDPKPIDSIRQLTQQERDALSIIPGILSEMEDILTDLTLEPNTNPQLRARMRQLAARSLLRDLRELSSTVNGIFASIPVLTGTIAGDETD